MTETEGGGKRLAGRRQFLAGLAVLPFGVAGCTFLNSESASPTTAADAKSFPVSVTHAFGTTVINSEPQRIATLGLGSNDICLALGVVPLAMPLSRAQPNGSTPWFDSAFRPFGLESPLLLDEEKGLPVDDLTGMGPDLILAVHSSLTRSEYEELSKIAPVVAYPDGPMATDWRTSLALVGTALGRADVAATVLAETETSIRSELGNYPDLAGTGFLVTRVRSALGADFEVFGEDSNPVRILQEFGLDPSASLRLVKELGRPVNPAANGAETYAWPAGRAAELGSDIAVFSVIHDEAPAIKNGGLLDPVPAHKTGNFILADSNGDGLALDTASCLSVRWLSRTMVPELARAAYGAKRGG
ncbi:ABC transporter substrate-binding protein [Micrococcaceae bacterium Sec5.8]